MAWIYLLGDHHDAGQARVCRCPAYLVLLAARQPTNGICYSFDLKWKSSDLPASVKIEDVTDACPVVLVDDHTPQLVNSCWGGVSAILPLNDPTLKWVQATEDAVRIYRFSVKLRSGNQFQLCQAVTYSYKYAAFIRRHFKPHPSQ